MPRINVKCKNCGNEYLAGDFLPVSKSKCPKCKNVGAVKTMVTFGGGSMCFKCNKLHTSGTKKCPICNGELCPQR